MFLLLRSMQIPDGQCINGRLEGAALLGSSSGILDAQANAMTMM